MDNRKRIYLDANATTPMRPEVLEAMLPYFRDVYGNASSVHAFGRQARYAVEVARETIARFIGAEAEEILFTSGGTEANNLAIKGFARRHGPAHFITSTIEHASVLRPAQQLEREGHAVTYLPVNDQGQIDVAALKEAITEKTLLVSVMHANNEVGTIAPLAQIGGITRERSVCLHTDAIQSVGKIPVNVKALGVDLLAVSAHKIAGPKGIGFLYKRVGVALAPEITGGAQERTLRAGTENVALIVAMAKAIELRAAEMAETSEKLKRLRDLFEQELTRRIPEACVMAQRVARLPNTSGVCFRGVDGGSLMRALDLAGIAVSTGSACMSGAVNQSHVLTAMGVAPELAMGAVRFSFGWENTEDEVMEVISVLEAILARWRA